jgi:peptide deformylase
MSILPITVYGDKILWKKTKDIEKIDDEVIMTVQNMFSTMRNASGIGLAANQVNLNKSIFVIDISPVEDYEDYKPVVMINPKILMKSEETEFFEEGCLSLPNLRADVERSKFIKVRYLNTDEKEVEIEADDLFARVILHEYDHLIGKMIPDRVTGDLKEKLKDELRLIEARKVDIDYPITRPSG